VEFVFGVECGYEDVCVDEGHVRCVPPLVWRSRFRRPSQAGLLVLSTVGLGSILLFCFVWLLM